MRIIGGQWRGKKILPPLSGSTRPTADRTREMIFNVLMHNPALGPQVLLQKAVLDVFAGTGALGLEALSRGAKSAIFVENNSESLLILHKNVAGISERSTGVIAENVQDLGRAPCAFDLIFLDPPYAQDLVGPTVTHLFSKGWLAPQAIIVMEVDKEETVNFPPFLSLITERLSGRTKIIFSAVHSF